LWRRVVWAGQLLIALMMEVASISETPVNFYQITRRYNPEDNNNLHTRHRENLKSYLIQSVCMSNECRQKNKK
jgi:hypothetical protein